MNIAHEGIKQFYRTVKYDTDPNTRALAFGQYMEDVHGDENGRQKISTLIQSHDFSAITAYERVAKAAMFADGNHTIHSDHSKLPVVRIKGHGTVEI